MLLSVSRLLPKSVTFKCGRGCRRVGRLPVLAIRLLFSLIMIFFVRRTCSRIFTVLRLTLCNRLTVVGSYLIMILLLSSRSRRGRPIKMSRWRRRSVRVTVPSLELMVSPNLGDTGLKIPRFLLNAGSKPRWWRRRM